MYWMILSILFTTISGTVLNYNLTVGDVKRLDVTVETTYTFHINAHTEFTGIIFQLHSQRHTITLSKSPNFAYEDTIQGRDIGLWQEISDSVVQFTFYAIISHINNDTSEQILILAAVTSVSNKAPIPGGCTLVSALNVDPNLQLTYSMYTTTIIFQDGNLGYIPTKNETLPQCSGSGDIDAYRQLKYTVYRQLLNIRDYSINSLFDALERIIKPNLEGLPHLTKDSNGIKSVTVDSFYGDGVIYAVVATSLTNGQTSVYVPAVTYACEFDLRETKCRDDLPLINIIVSPLLGLVGLLMCLFAHRLFHIEVLVFSWIIILLVTYIIFSAFLPTTHTVRVALALSSSLVISFLLFLIWFFTGWYLPFIFLFSGITGFLIAAILLYSPFGMFTIWKISYVYGLFIACLVVLILIPGVIFPRAMNIFATSLIGSYLVVYAIGTFVFTSLNEIVMRVVKVVSVSGYLATDEVYPFQLNDILLSCGWSVLLVASIIVQALLARGRDPFPKTSLYKQCRNKWRKRSNRLQQPAINNENRKLLNSYCGSPRTRATYGAFASQ